jgi:glycosyltransferase involved in cell wall biosynthesis
METIHRADVIVPVYRDTQLTLHCLGSVLDLSGSPLRKLIVIDDASPEPDMFPALQRLAQADARVRLLRNPSNLGFVRTCNRGLAERAGDAVLLNSDTLVTRGWLRELAEVAHSDERTACVSPLSNNATICSVPRFCDSTPPDLVDEEAVRVATARLPRSTIVPTGIGFCMYLRGDVIDLVGELDPIFLRGYNEENDWAMRAQAMGFVALRANRAFVYHFGSVSFQAEQAKLDRRNTLILDVRHPHYLPQVRRFCTTLDSHLAAHAVRVESSGKLRVALDLRNLPPDAVGTRVYAVGLARALACSSELELTLIVRQPAQANKIPGRVVCGDQFLGDVEVIHRIGQVFDPSDLELLFGTPAHTVISHLDLIAHRAQGNFSSPAAADRYRTMSYMVLHGAQATFAISRHAKSEIVSEYGVPEESIFITPLGVDSHRFDRRSRDDGSILRALGVPARYFLSVGTDFPHKNLPNLLGAYAHFRRQWRQGVPPSLILSGNKTDQVGGFYDQLKSRPREGVIYLGAVKDEDLLALYHGAIALIFPSVYEGFGLPVLEAMAVGTPVIALPFSSIPEVGGDSLLYPDGTSPEALAGAMKQLCDHPAMREDLSERGRRHSERFHWEQTAQLTIDVYKSVISNPFERSLTSRRYLREAILNWAEPGSGALQLRPIGIRNALKELDRAVKARARRDFGWIRPRLWNRSA